MKKILIPLIIVVISAISGWWFCNPWLSTDSEPIKVGILHSLTGTMSISEKSVVDSTLMAIEEINLKGGLLGKRIDALVVDGRSDWPRFAEEAERLITVEKVSVVFGCWTSASRKTVKPVFEKNNHLLFYPVQHEGLEQSPNIIYTGATPNQQIIPAVKWCFDNLGKRFFLVASDYVFPRSANAIIKDQASALGAEIVGEEYVLLGSSDVGNVIMEIAEKKPDVIINTLNGDTNITFFRELRKAGITSDKIPTMSFSITEVELHTIGTSNIVGDYACWNYFQSVNSIENIDFVKRFKVKYGSHRVVGDPMEAGYFGVYLWAQAVKKAGSASVNNVIDALGRQSFQAPEGYVCIDHSNNHLWKTVRIGRVTHNGQFDILWNSGKPVRPVPYPASRDKSEWNEFLRKLYEMWDKKWANPGK
ncbi:MAG: urea ABC transporter substrate-binding protein [Candidatus Brocadiaceae bacterium]|nr:urea ABC transporter substrate-binding protein [Candidatus Brocadiaceae bacterium]